MLPDLVITIEQAFQLALLVKHYLQTPTLRRGGSQVKNSITKKFTEAKAANTTSNATQGTNTILGPTRDKGKGIVVDLTNKAETTHCFRCHKQGHKAYNAPVGVFLWVSMEYLRRNLLK